MVYARAVQHGPNFGAAGATVASGLLLAGLALAPESARAGEPAEATAGPADAEPNDAEPGETAPNVCVSAYEDNQILRRGGELLAARDKLLVCAQSQCPEAVRADCMQWLDELQRSIPTIVVAARDVSGADTTSVRLFIDGALAAESLDGRPIALDPGAHDLRFEHGDERIDQKVVVQQGAHERAIVVSFAPETPPAAAPVSPPPPDVAEEPGPPALAFVLGGLGLAALGAFAGFGLVGRSEAGDLNDTCGPTRTCAESDIDAARTKLIVADVSLGVGVVSLGIATTLLVLHATSEPEAAFDAGASVGRSGASGWLSARF